MRTFKSIQDLNLVKDSVGELIKATAWFFVSSEGYSDSRHSENRWIYIMETIREKVPDYKFLFKKPDEILNEFDRVTSDIEVAKSDTPF